MCLGGTSLSLQAARGGVRSCVARSSSSCRMDSRASCFRPGGQRLLWKWEPESGCARLAAEVEEEGTSRHRRRRRGLSLSPWEGSRSVSSSSSSSPVPGREPVRARLCLVRALDAAMPFDYEHIQQGRLAQQGRLKVGMLGFGNFGQFLAKRILSQDHSVIAWSRSDYSDTAHALGVRFLRDVHDFCEEHPDVVILSCSILSARQVLRSLPLQRLKRSTLFVDVLSVKEFPKQLLLQVLPLGFDILCTHPMFGPESGKASWEGLPFVYERVRVGASEARRERCLKFLQIFEREGCRMVEMTCEEHDRFAAGTQFVTHTVGRVLGRLGLESTPINTKGYETLLNLVENTGGDSFDLYYGLFMYNTNATEELQRLESAFDAVKKQLLDQLHSVLREQLLLGEAPQHAPSAPKAKQKQKLLLPTESSFGSSQGSSNGDARQQQQAGEEQGQGLHQEDGVMLSRQG